MGLSLIEIVTVIVHDNRRTILIKDCCQMATGRERTLLFVRTPGHAGRRVLVTKSSIER